MQSQSLGPSLVGALTSVASVPNSADRERTDTSPRAMACTADNMRLADGTSRKTATANSPAMGTMESAGRPRITMTITSTANPAIASHSIQRRGKSFRVCTRRPIRALRSPAAENCRTNSSSRLSSRASLTPPKPCCSTRNRCRSSFLRSVAIPFARASVT